MADQLTLTIPAAVVQAIEDVVRRAVADVLAVERLHAPTSFLGVDAAAAYLASTPTAIRSLVKRSAIPYYKAPNGRLLFDREELQTWVKAG